MFRNIFLLNHPNTAKSNIMDKDLIIDVGESGVEIALLEDKRLVELHQGKTDSTHVVGDI